MESAFRGPTLGKSCSRPLPSPLIPSPTIHSQASDVRKPTPRAARDSPDLQLGNVKEARALATEITTRGARLYDLLDKEAEARPQRLKAVAFLEVRGWVVGRLTN